MTEKQLLFPQKRLGKCVMQENEWTALKCRDCGGEMDLIKNNEFEEVKECKECKSRYLLVKRVRDETKGE